VYGTFSTWIGAPEKNRAWELLTNAKKCFDMVAGEGQLPRAVLDSAARQLADCESSDWFWWPGDYNPAAAVNSFDRLYRSKLENLYRLLALPVPPELAQPIGGGGQGADGAGTMRRAVVVERP
jgi:alpha-amylase/alpha-mannosidase (GH57 family)